MGTAEENEPPLHSHTANFPPERPSDLGFPSCEHSSGQARSGLGQPRGHLLGWLFHSAVGIEGLQLVLDATQGIGQLPVIEGHDRLLDPLQQL